MPCLASLGYADEGSGALVLSHIWQAHEDVEDTLEGLKWLRQLVPVYVSSQCLPADYLVSGPAG